MKPKRGDVREDGMVFWVTNRGRDVWVDLEKFTENQKKSADLKRRYRDCNREKIAAKMKEYLISNKGKSANHMRRYNRKKAFRKEDGTSFRCWLKSIKRPSNVFKAIANLQPDPGQTLAELIHELSGYAMEVCEQIANPPVIEDASPAQPTPQTDLF